MRSDALTIDSGVCVPNAARVAYAHALGTPRVSLSQLEDLRRQGVEVPTIVTASCDRIVLLNHIRIDRDLKFRGNQEYHTDLRPRIEDR